MKLHNLKKTTTKSRKRVGRGYGSGVGGHTSTRGMKGQKSRSSVALWFEGGQLPLVKRMPFLRGKDRFKATSNTTVVNLSDLSKLSGKTVSKETLAKANIISVKEAANTTIKLLGNGDATDKYTVEGIKVSASAKAKIEKAGGTIK